MEKLNKIIELLDKGAEPEYLQIKTPVNDNDGFYVSIEWMHHDGTVGDAFWNGLNLNDIFDRIITYLEDRSNYLGNIGD